MEWIFLGILVAFFFGTIALLMGLMLLFPVTRWIILGLAFSAIVATLFFIGGTKTMWIPIGLGIGVIGIIILFPLFVWGVLAPSNRFFTFVKEGTAKIVVKADQYNKTLIQWKDYTLDDEGNVVKDGTRKKGRTYREPRHLFGGLRFYGLWPLLDIYTYRLRWTSIRQDGAISPHDEMLDYALLKDHLYLVKIDRAEDKDMVPLDIELLVTMRVVNPYRAIFRVQDWVEMVLGRMKPLFRQYVAENTFKQLVERKQQAGGELWERLLKTGEIKLFRNEYGIEVREGGVEMKDITPPPQYQEAATRKYLAEREKERITVEAEAEATRLKTVYEMIQKFGDLGKLVRTLEAVEKSPLSASLTVQAVPGLQEILRGVFGKPTEAITREEFRELREMVEGLTQRRRKGG